MKDTATSLLIDRDRHERDGRMFELMMEAFQKRWAPSDRRDAAEFNAELFSIVRQIYHDASEPWTKQLTAIYSAMTVHPIIMPKADK